ncbi:MAG: rhodanese-like domain-containing protein [Alphaproteobacteria bacterium]|nr:rhodanese-like domain-containing protein [Alphaproteobacteria bacterium]
MHFRYLALSLFSLTGMSLTVIDVRTEAEWNTGHLEGAFHIEWQDILELSSNIPKDEEIYLYCRSGNRSGKATKILLDAGYVNAKNAGSISEASKLLNTKIID